MGLAQQQTAPPGPMQGVPAFGGMFQKKPEIAPIKESSELTETITSTLRRLRVIETRFENIHKKLQFVEQNMLEQQKKVHAEIKATSLDVLEIKRGMLELQNRVRTLAKEVQMRASKEDVEVLKRYLQFWEPIKFVTAEQVEKIVARVLKEGQPKVEVIPLKRVNHEVAAPVQEDNEESEPTLDDRAR